MDPFTQKYVEGFMAGLIARNPGESRHKTGGVGILNAENQFTAVLFRKEVVVECSTNAADM